MITLEELEEFRIALSADIHSLPDEPVQYSQHERQISDSMFGIAAAHEQQIQDAGYDTILLAHYLLGEKHPHDYNLPLNQWDATPD